jgi:hypothetical protein
MTWRNELGMGTREGSSARKVRVLWLLGAVASSLIFTLWMRHGYNTFGALLGAAVLGWCMGKSVQGLSSSPSFYKNTAIIFFIIGAILVWAAITSHSHSWFFWAFAAITILNGLMSVLKFRQLRETKN